MEVQTGYLDKGQVESELAHIASFFGKHCDSASYMFGWACNVHIDEQWQLNEMPVDKIGSMVIEFQKKGIFNYCQSDLYLYDGKDRFYFLLCHECDVHFSSEDQGFISMVEQDWRSRGHSVREVKPQSLGD